MVNSLIILKQNLDYFIIRSYHYFLQTESGLKIQSTSIQDQFKLFHSSISIILTYINKPAELDKYLQIIKEEQQRDIIFMIEYNDDFVESFIHAINEIFMNDESQQVLSLWKKVIKNILFYFKFN